MPPRPPPPLLKALLSLWLASLAAGCDAERKPSPPPSASSDQPATATARAGGDLATDPALILRRFDPAAVTLDGIRIGQPAADIPAETIREVSERDPEIIKLLPMGRYHIDLKTGNRVEIANDRVKTLILYDEAALAKIGLAEAADVELTLGKADRVLEDHTGKDVTRRYVYLDRRLTAQTRGGPIRGDYVIRLEVR